MKRKMLSFLLTLVILFSLAVPAYAASEVATNAADSLYLLGLFNGTGKDANGKPIYDLELVPTRNQAVTMLVRLLGKATVAESQKWSTPFTDESEWAKPYVGYAYANGLTAGTSATTYSGSRNATVGQYLTFILRALGYQSGVDFEYSKAWEFSDSIGLTDGRYSANTSDFRRSDVAEISYDALYVFKKGTSTMLGEFLASEGTIDLSKFVEVSPSPFSIINGEKCYSRYPAILSFDNVCPATKFWFESEMDLRNFGIAYQYDYYYSMATLAEAESYAQKYSDFLVRYGCNLINVGDKAITEERDIAYELTSKDGSYGIEIATSGSGGCTVTVSITPPPSVRPSEGNVVIGNPVDGNAKPGSTAITMYDRYHDVPDFASVSGDDLIVDKGSSKAYSSSHLSDYVSIIQEYGYQKAGNYSEKYENSQLSTQYGNVSIYKNSTGREIHVLEVKDPKTSSTLAFVSVDAAIKKPLIGEAISAVVAQQNPYEDASCPYKNDSNNYKYGNTDVFVK